MSSGWIGSFAANAVAGRGVWQYSASCAAMRWCMNFSTGPEIGECGRMGRYFSAMLPLEGRSERGTPIAVLVGRNGGRRKKLSTIEYYDNSRGLPELTTHRNPNPSILKLFYGSDTMCREKEYTDSR